MAARPLQLWRCAAPPKAAADDLPAILLYLLGELGARRQNLGCPRRRRCWRIAVVAGQRRHLFRGVVGRRKCIGASAELGARHSRIGRRKALQPAVVHAEIGAADTPARRRRRDGAHRRRHLHAARRQPHLPRPAPAAARRSVLGGAAHRRPHRRESERLEPAGHSSQVGGHQQRHARAQRNADARVRGELLPGTAVVAMRLRRRAARLQPSRRPGGVGWLLADHPRVRQLPCHTHTSIGRRRPCCASPVPSARRRATRRRPRRTSSQSR